MFTYFSERKRETQKSVKQIQKERGKKRKRERKRGWWKPEKER